MTFEKIELVIMYTPLHQHFLLQGEIVHNGLQAKALLSVGSDRSVDVHIFYT